MKLKKIPYYLAVGVLTCGASLILGLLSFTGMIGLYPILGLAIASFGLSVAYEGEIYLQNIKGAYDKLFKTNYLERRLAKTYLLEHFPEGDDVPQFFKDYKAQLERLATFGHKNLNADSLARKKREEKVLSDMEKLFALELFQAEGRQESLFTTELRDWLANNQQAETIAKLESRSIGSYFIKFGSTVAAVFAGFGTTYLLMEAFAVIPFLAAVPAIWPAIIIPLAVVAGVAYGMLVYNAVMDFINNETLKKWYNKFDSDWKKEGLSLRNVGMAVITLSLLALAAILTVFTAGTWWTVADKAVPLYEWMKKIPTLAIGIVTGLGSLAFIVQNTFESLDLVDEGLAWVEKVYRKGFVKKVWDPLKEWASRFGESENGFQMINPARLLIKLTVTPLRVLLFIGHLISIAFTADRMPSVPEIVGFIIALISEGFEDVHYFIGHSHDHHHHSTKDLLKERLDAGHGHNHDMDIPTWMIKGLALPLYGLATAWDWAFSERNVPGNRLLALYESWNKQFGNAIEEEVSIPKEFTTPSFEGHQTLISYKLDKLATKQEAAWLDSELAGNKKVQLNLIKVGVNNSVNREGLANTLVAAKDNVILNQHRLFALGGEKTKTQESVEALLDGICLN